MIKLLVVLLVIIMVVLVLMMIRRRPSPPARPQRESPREILQRRYAAGEIDEDEYLRRMSGLNQDW
ncbi:MULTISPECIES: SHOCT domain-containing protein [Nonomuraea]|uniref:SHOCT domain-containing protein n=1 Tax=Nonomuraea mangrovi TaxID=2316207 RepID=A0ABW4TG58_9ACTN